MTDFTALLTVLADSQVEFAIVGGVAAIIHGSARVTFDLDVVYGRSATNLARLVSALAPYEPYLRGAPPGLPFKFDQRMLERGLNFTLVTTLGPLDLLGEMAGVGGYEDIRPSAVEAEFLGIRCLCVNLPQLIQAKRAAGRAKDLEVIGELEILLHKNRSAQ